MADGTSRRDGEASCRDEVLWPVGSSRRGEGLWPMELHVEVERLDVEMKCCGQCGSSRRGEELWPMKLHVEVKCCGQLDLT